MKKDLKRTINKRVSRFMGSDLVEVGVFPDSKLNDILEKTGLQNKIKNDIFFCNICKFNVSIGEFGSIAKINNKFELVCNNIECISKVQRILLKNSRHTDL